MSKAKAKRDKRPAEFQRFEELAKNLVSVSNAEVREKMAEEKRQKKVKKDKREAS